MKFSSLAISLAAAGVMSFGSFAAFAAQVPGTAPAAAEGATPVPSLNDGIEAASGLKVFYRRYGKYSLSVDAKGSNDTSHKIKVLKPHKKAKVIKAYLLASSHGTTSIANGDISLNNKKITWSAAIYNDTSNNTNFFHSVLADVTSIVKPIVNAKNGAGYVNFKIKELLNNSRIDGEILAVVFSDPSLKKKHTVALLFGGQQISGDRFEINLANKINPATKTAVANMGLGISYGYQANGGSQYSIVDVNGKRLSTSAGGEDDGASANGALITAGGIKDNSKNPANPNATPANPRTDDESYTLLTHINKNTKTIYVDTSNPSDDDNIFFAWFELSAKGEVNKDTDGDGLLDTWEKNGYDHDGDGKIDVPIHKRGANWKKKDIFVAYAWMEASGSETKSHKPSAKVLKAVVKAFARAPVSNPSGSKGIKLHFLNKGSVAHDDDLNPVWPEFDALMDPKVSEAERRIYHRMLNAHMYSGGTSSGLSRGLPASDFIESLGGWSSNPGTFMQRAGTIMHELGHNLNLRHGGPDHENYKPNHLSVMSYFNQMDWLIRKGKPYLDYERFDLRDLDEANLNEKKGLDRVGGDNAIKTYGARWYGPGPVAKVKTTSSHKNVDWNNNSTPTNTGVMVDLNNSGGNSVLRARYPEWKNIVYDGGSVGPGIESVDRNMVTSPSDLKELTYEEYLEMQGDNAEAK